MALVADDLTALRKGAALSLTFEGVGGIRVLVTVEIKEDGAVHARAEAGEPLTLLARGTVRGEFTDEAVNGLVQDLLRTLERVA
jgi:hypothetical protein